MDLIVFFIVFNQFIFTAFGGSGFSTFLSIRRLLAFRRARLSALLYKSIKRMCLFDFEFTNVEGNVVVSKSWGKKICGYRTAVREAAKEAEGAKTFHRRDAGALRNRKV